MREIKFRGKSLETGEWVYGDLLQYDDGSVCIGVHSKNYTDDGFNVGHYKHIISVDEDTIGQYTGMEDRNGKEIYEGDIILQQGYHGGNEKMVVRFEHGAFIVGYHNGSSTIKRPMLINKKCKTLGNIYDNPELLKEG